MQISYVDFSRHSFIREFFITHHTLISASIYASWQCCNLIRLQVSKAVLIMARSVCITHPFLKREKN